MCVCISNQEQQYHRFEPTTRVVAQRIFHKRKTILVGQLFKRYFAIRMYWWHIISTGIYHEYNMFRISHYIRCIVYICVRISPDVIQCTRIILKVRVSHQSELSVNQGYFTCRFSRNYQKKCVIFDLSRQHNFQDLFHILFYLPCVSPIDGYEIIE